MVRRAASQSSAARIVLQAPGTPLFPSHAHRSPFWESSRNAGTPLVPWPCVRKGVMHTGGSYHGPPVPRRSASSRDPAPRAPAGWIKSVMNIVQIRNYVKRLGQTIFRRSGVASVG
jgi:hypothetical protein